MDTKGCIKNIQIQETLPPLQQEINKKQFQKQILIKNCHCLARTLLFRQAIEKLKIEINFIKPANPV